MAAPLSAAQMLAVAKSTGFPLRTYSGWETRTRSSGGNFAPRGVVVHITAGALGSRNAEQYIRDIILGDAAVSFKAQFVTEPDGTIWLVGTGRANHAGYCSNRAEQAFTDASFPTTGTVDWRGRDTNPGAFTYGIENIAAVSMTDRQRAASVALCAAIARHYGWTGGEMAGHGEIASDRGPADPNLDMGRFRADVMTAVKGGTSPAPAPASQPPKENPMGWQIPIGTKDNETVGWVLHVLYNLFDYEDFSKNTVAGKSFGPEDGTPVAIFQDVVGVRCTGLIDEETWRWTEKWASDFALDWKNALPGGLPLDIRALQISLMKLGFMDWKHRGDIGTYGPATTKAVNDYIRARGLGTPDGRVGPKTFGTLSAEGRLFNCTTPVQQVGRATTGPGSLPAPAKGVATPVPGAWISARFGQRPKNNTYWKAKGYHTGRDYAAGHGTPILAVRDGVVTARWDNTLGNLAILAADNGRYYWYSHTTKGSRQTGRVKAGQRIATVGASGSGASGGPHLHLEDASSGTTWGVGLRDPQW